MEILFYGIIALAFITITALEEFKHGVLAFLTTVATAVFLMRGRTHEWVAYVHQHPGIVAIYVAAYFATGVAWGTIKWWRYVSDQYSLFLETKEKFLKSVRAKSGDARFDIQTAFVQELSWARVEHNPQVRTHKDDIVRWMTFWPFSFIWTMIDDPITRSFRFMFNSIKGLLQDISDQRFKNASTKLDIEELPGTVTGRQVQKLSGMRMET